MAFPVPPDARATGNFELVRGLDEMIRQSMALADEAAPVDEGEWMKPATSGGVTKAAKSVGQSDAMATKSVDLLSGSYQAKTKLYNTASGVLAPGNLLVAVYDATQEGGILDAVDPSTATVRQLQAVVGRIIEVASGVMHYEAPGL